MPQVTLQDLIIKKVAHNKDRVSLLSYCDLFIAKHHNCHITILEILRKEGFW